MAGPPRGARWVRELRGDSEHRGGSQSPGWGRWPSEEAWPELTWRIMGTGTRGGCSRQRGVHKVVWERPCLGTRAVQCDWITRWEWGCSGRWAWGVRGLGHPDKELGPNLHRVGNLHLWESRRHLLGFAFWRVILEVGIEKWLGKFQLSLTPGPSVFAPPPSAV